MKPLAPCWRCGSDAVVFTDDERRIALCGVCLVRLETVEQQKQVARDHVPSGLPREFYGQNHDYSPCEPDKHVYLDNCYCNVCGEKLQDCG